TTLIIKPHEAKIENIDGQLFYAIGPFSLQKESEDRIRLNNVTFTYPSYPNPPVPGGPVSITVTFDDGIKYRISKVGAPLPFVEFREHQDQQAGVRRNADGTFNFLLSADKQSLSPLKQIKSGVPLVDVQCSDGKHAVYKYNRMRVACVTEETQSELWNRGWATMRFYTEENTSAHALCNNFEGKWHPENGGCRNISDHQCSLIGGEFVHDVSIYSAGTYSPKIVSMCVTMDAYDDEDFTFYRLLMSGEE
ncbi:MAG: hypothetical protein ACE5RC_09010, partial [Nitrosopumilus sp.]